MVDFLKKNVPIVIVAQTIGEVVKLFVVKKDESLTEEELIAFCREHLTGYKVPKSVEFRDDLPKSNVGKILRALRLAGFIESTRPGAQRCACGMEGAGCYKSR